MILKMGKSHEDRHCIHEHKLHQHLLCLQEAQGPYKCNGCKQPGFRTCYECPENICDFYLHIDCFRTKHNTEKRHIFMGKCVFVFPASPPRIANKYCDACGLDILGFRYECSCENPHDLHPTCAHIDLEMDWDGLKYELRDKVESKCLHCNQRYPAEECVGFTGWKWVAEKRHYGFPSCFWGRKNCFHVKCMNEIMAPKEEKFDEYEMYHKCSIIE